MLLSSRVLTCLLSRIKVGRVLTSLHWYMIGKRHFNSLENVALRSQRYIQSHDLSNHCRLSCFCDHFMIIFSEISVSHCPSQIDFQFCPMLSRKRRLDSKFVFQHMFRRFEKFQFVQFLVIVSHDQRETSALFNYFSQCSETDRFNNTISVAKLSRGDVEKCLRGVFNKNFTDLIKT